MENNFKDDSRQSPSSFQKQKLYIEELTIDSEPRIFERKLKSFLSRFGNIIDIKILKNSKLNREFQTLCFCHL